MSKQNHPALAGIVSLIWKLELDLGGLDFCARLDMAIIVL